MFSETEKKILRYYLKTWKKNSVFVLPNLEKFNWADECDKELS
jgi:hypothetical protein